MARWLCGINLGKAALTAALVLLADQTSVQAFDLRKNFIDPEDGHLDASEFLSKGGFIPVPIIITEPAVKGGAGFLGQFIRPSDTPGIVPDRTMAGGAVTGNGSWGGGIMQQGTLREGRLVYRAGLGAADMTLPFFPFGGSTSIDYGNKAKFAFGNLRYQFGDTPFSAGPRLIYRTSEVSLKTSGPLAGQVGNLLDRLGEEETYSGLGLSLNYDTRNNPLTPTRGINAMLQYDVYDGAWGSDRDFSVAGMAFHGFTGIGKAWTLGGKIYLEGMSSDGPFFMSPGIDLRGVQYGRYQGDAALSVETELRRQFSPRWAGVLFGGYGETFVEDSRLLQAEDGIWTFGAGIRYQIARRYGIDVGLDVARGPEETVVYFQFAHAWMRTMD